MEQSDFLELNLLENNDYAGHWDIPANENLTVIDEECEEIATELLTTPDSPYAGHLRGSAASLEARLNVAMSATGAILYNSNDLDKSCHQMDGFETTEIHRRLGNVDRREFVNARLRYLQQTVATGEYLNKTNAYDPTSILSDTDTSRHADNFAQRYGSQLFCFNADCVDPTHAGAGVININPLGWCSIGGRLYYHKNTSYHTLVADSQWQMVLTEEPYVSAGVVNIDNRVIRSSTSPSGPCAPGDTEAYGSTFTAANIGIASSGTGNNDWLPEAFQILRVEVSAGVFEEYLIKSITDANHVEIYGEFPYAAPLVARDWWVLDYTIPCVNLKPFVFATVTDLQTLMNSIYLYSNSHLSTHMLTYTHATGTFYASRMHGVGNYIYTNPQLLFVDMSSETLVPGEEYFQVDLDLAGVKNITPYNIKRMSVLCLEKWSDNVINTWFTFTVDPKTNYGTNYFIPIVHPEIIRRMSMTGLLEIQDTWFDAPLPGGVFGVNTYLRVHCTGANDDPLFNEWTTPPDGSAAFKGRQWWGVLLEYA